MLAGAGGDKDDEEVIVVIAVDDDGDVEDTNDKDVDNDGGATGQSGIQMFAGNGTTNRATRIDFFNINVLKWTILNDYYQTGIDGFEILNAANNTCFYIKQDGSVGIGIYNPNSSYKLTVNGATYLSGNTTINGTCSATTFSGSGASLTSIPYSS